MSVHNWAQAAAISRSSVPTVSISARAPLSEIDRPATRNSARAKSIRSPSLVSFAQSTRVAPSASAASISCLPRAPPLCVSTNAQLVVGLAKRRADLVDHLLRQLLDVPQDEHATLAEKRGTGQLGELSWLERGSGKLADVGIGVGGPGARDNGGDRALDEQLLVADGDGHLIHGGGHEGSMPRRRLSASGLCTTPWPLRVACETPRITPMTSDEPAAILAVCTGNLCRSPVVERLFRLGFTTHWPTATSALAGRERRDPRSAGPPNPRVAHVAIAIGRRRRFAVHTPRSHSRHAGRRGAGHRPHARTSSRRRRAASARSALHLHAAGARETGRIALPPGDRAPLEPLARLQTFVAAAAGARGAQLPGDPSEDDVPDPYGGNDARYAKVWASLHEATSSIVTALCSTHRPAFRPA